MSNRISTPENYSATIQSNQLPANKQTMDTEPISSPTSDYAGHPGVRKRKRPNRPNDAVYPREEKVEIEVEQLEALQKMVEEIEGKLTVLKEMIKLVVNWCFLFGVRPLLFFST